MEPLTFRATITVEVKAMNRREAEQAVLGVMTAITDTSEYSGVTTTWPLPEPKVVAPSVVH